jgi:two-component system response regulator YesN
MVQSHAVNEYDTIRLFSVVRGAIEYSQTFFERLSGRTFSVVVESTAIDYQEISSMFYKMKQIMVGGLGREKDVIAHVETVKARSTREASGKAIAKIPMLKAHLEMHRRQEFFDLLDEVGDELLTCRSRHDSNGMGLYYSVSVLLLQFINENQLNEQIAFHVGLYKLTRVDEHLSWNAALHYLYDVSAAIFELLGSHDKDLSDRALKRICDYIEDHLEQELSLTKLADVGGFNSSYLSRLFKQVYDVTITDYIYQKRMKRAAFLLKTTSDKIQDIAEKSGYLSSHSFSRAFRGFYKVSPAEYRENSKNEYGKK